MQKKRDMVLPALDLKALLQRENVNISTKVAEKPTLTEVAVRAEICFIYSNSNT